MLPPRRRSALFIASCRSRDIYFLANTSNHPVEGAGEIPRDGLQAGSLGPVHRQADLGRREKLDLNLAPYESRVVVFSKDAASGLN